jgi:hypothetical protein
MNPRIWLYALSLCAIVLSACDTPASIGNDLQPDELLIKTEQVDTFKIRLRSYKIDSVKTLGASNMLIGHVSHPVFGKITASSFANMDLLAGVDSLSLQSGDVKTPPVYDSTYISFDWDYAFGEEAQTASRRLLVKELQQPLDTTGGKSYYQFSTVPVSNNILLDTMYSFASTSSNIARFRLGDEMGRKLIELATQGKINFREAVYDVLKGISVESDASGQSIFGSSLLGNTQISVYYHYIRNANDTVRAAVLLRPGLRFNHIEADRTGTALAGLENGEEIKSEDLENIGVLQCGAGIGLRMELPDFANFSYANKVAINRAQLFINPVPGSVQKNQLPPTTLYFARVNDQGKVLFSSNGSVALAANMSGGSVNTQYIGSGQSYTFADLTSYIEAAANGVITGNDLIIYPRDQINNSVNWLQLGDSKHPGDFPLELRIYYTKFN